MKKLLMLIGCVLSLSVFNAQAVDGYIYFHGSIVEPACEMKMDEGSNTVKSSCYQSSKGKYKENELDLNKLIKTKKMERTKEYNFEVVNIDENNYVGKMYFH